VPVSESQQIADALKEAGDSGMAPDCEGRGATDTGKKPNQDFQFYSTVEFLQEYLLK